MLTFLAGVLLGALVAYFFTKRRYEDRLRKHRDVIDAAVNKLIRQGDSLCH